MPFAPLLAMPLDKSADSFGQGSIDTRNDLSDQYLTFDALNVDDSVYLSAPESMHLVSKVKGSDSASSENKMWKDVAGQKHAPSPRGEPLQTERAASLHHKLIGNIVQFKDSGRAAGPNFEMLSLEKISLRSPRLKTPPSPPELLIAEKTKSAQRILQGFHKPFQNEKQNKVLRKSTSPIRKATCPAKMRRSQYGDGNNHNWGQQLDSDAPKFDFGFQNTPLSPPPSCRVSESSESNSQMMAATQQNNSSYAWDPPISEQYAYRDAEDIESPLTTPPADMTTFQQSNMQNTSTNNMTYTTSHRDQSSTQWMQTPMNSDYTLQTSTPYIEEPESPIWWEDAATTPLLEPAPPAYPRQNLQSMQLQADLVYNTNELALSPSNMPSGLMIQMPNTPTGTSFVVATSPMNSQQGYFMPAAASSGLQPHQALHSQPQSYAPPIRSEKPHQSHSHSHSNSHSHSHSHSKTEPLRKSPPPRARSSSTHVSKKSHRSSSSSHHSKREHGQSSSKTSKSSTPKVAVGNFVNFTPKDSNKILTGVAPSGSSKTKARREREAAEKTRRLSKAAVKAVRDAGGSIDTLVEEGIFDEADEDEDEV